MEPYELIRSRRKTLALEITKDCRVLVRAPMRMPETRILAFVESHGDWIARHLDRQRQRAAALPPPPTAEEIETLKARARAELPPKIAFWSEKMGVAPPASGSPRPGSDTAAAAGRTACAFPAFS